MKEVRQEVENRVGQGVEEADIHKWGRRGEDEAGMRQAGRRGGTTGDEVRVHGGLEKMRPRDRRERDSKTRPDIMRQGGNKEWSNMGVSK